MAKKKLFDGTRAKKRRTEKAKTILAADGVDSSNTEEEDEYELEYIKDFTVKKNQEMYLIKWKGYAESESTWEPESNVMKIDEATQYRMTYLRTAYYKKKKAANITAVIDEEDLTSAEEQPKAKAIPRKGKTSVSKSAKAVCSPALKSTMKSAARTSGATNNTRTVKTSTSATTPTRRAVGRSVDGGSPSSRKSPTPRYAMDQDNSHSRPTKMRAVRKVRHSVINPAVHQRNLQERRSSSHAATTAYHDDNEECDTGNPNSNNYCNLDNGNTLDEGTGRTGMVKTRTGGILSDAEHVDGSTGGSIKTSAVRCSDDGMVSSSCSPCVGESVGRRYVDTDRSSEGYVHAVNEFLRMLDRRGAELCRRCKVMSQHVCVCDARTLFISQISDREEGKKFVRVCSAHGGAKCWQSVEMARRFMSEPLVEFFLKKAIFQSTCDNKKHSKRRSSKRQRERTESTDTQNTAVEWRGDDSANVCTNNSINHIDNSSSSASPVSLPSFNVIAQDDSSGGGLDATNTCVALDDWPANTMTAAVDAIRNNDITSRDGLKKGHLLNAAYDDDEDDQGGVCTIVSDTEDCVEPATGRCSGTAETSTAHGHSHCDVEDGTIAVEPQSDGRRRGSITGSTPVADITGSTGGGNMSEMLMDDMLLLVLLKIVTLL
eukprot:Lankesteria_metandrocarpae@DN2941_c0_g1_i2.p1